MYRVIMSIDQGKGTPAHSVLCHAGAQAPTRDGKPHKWLRFDAPADDKAIAKFSHVYVLASEVGEPVPDKPAPVIATDKPAPEQPPAWFQAWLASQTKPAKVKAGTK